MSNGRRLKAFIAAENVTIRRIVRHYVLKSGLVVPGQDATPMTDELVNTLVVEALRHADRLPSADNPLPWLLGIALNLVKRELAARAKLDQREPLLHDLFLDESSNTLSEDELIDQFLAPTAHNTLSTGDSVTELLQDLSPQDAHVIQLAVLHELDGQALAAELGIAPGAARVRLHRALKRLRRALENRMRNTNHEEF